MKLITATWWILVAAQLAAASEVDQLDQLASRDSSVIPGAYIVEFSPGTGERAAQVQSAFFSKLDELSNGQFTVRRKYTSPIFNGVSVQLKTHQHIQNFASFPNVVAVTPVTKIPGPQFPVKQDVQGDMVQAGLNVHVMTGVDKLHAAGITGKGVTITMLDSGVDYYHAALGGGFGPGFKVIGGYDFVGTAGSGAPEPDDDPFDDNCGGGGGGHGTMIAGIIGATPDTGYNITGVAYDAQLLAYRVFDCYGFTENDILIEAALRAYDDGADIIVMAFGGEDPALITAATRLADGGRIVASRAGDSSSNALMKVTSPARAKGVIGVGSVNNIVTSAAYLQTSVEHDSIIYDTASIPVIPGVPINMPDVPYQVYALTKSPNEINTACTPLGDDVPDLSPYAVIVRANMTECDSYWQAEYLAEKGARFVIYFDISEPEFFEAPDRFSAVLLRSHDDAAFLIEEVARNPNLTVTINHILDAVNPDTGGLISRFTNFGLHLDGELTPALSAPGGNITTIVPENLGIGKWYLASTTEFSSAYVGGSAALILQAKGKPAAKRVRELLQTTASTVPSSKEPSAVPVSPAQQGAGLINVFVAVNTRTSLSPAELALNDANSAAWIEEHTLTVSNDGDAVQTYQVRHVPGPTFQTKLKDRADWNRNPLPVLDTQVAITLSSDSITLQPGASSTLTITISPPDGIDPLTIPAVAGWITITGSEGDSVKATYFGIAGSPKQVQTVSTGNRFFTVDGGLPAIIPAESPLQAQNGPRNYTLEDPTWPYFFSILSTPSRRAVLDLISADTTLKSNVPHPENGGTTASASRPRWMRSPHHKREGTFDDVAIEGRLIEWLDTWRDAAVGDGASNYHGGEVPKAFTNGSAIPFGQHRLLLRALRLGGDPNREEDYDIWVSEQFGIVAP